jgi:hypothetical protein
MLVFRQLFDQQSLTYTYLLADSGSRLALLGSIAARAGELSLSS